MHYGRNIYGQLLQLCTAQTHCLRIPRLGTDPFFYVSQVVVVDEIGTELEAAAARTISQRGVQMIATAHGHTLENLLKNPTLNDLVGGVTSVTLGDDEARRRRVQKSVLEREGPPTFGVAVEMLEIGRWRVHLDVGVAVDTLLQGYEPHVEIRAFDENTGHVIKQPWLGEGVYGVNGGGLFSASSGKGLSQSPHTASLIAHTRLKVSFLQSGPFGFGGTPPSNTAPPPAYRSYDRILGGFGDTGAGPPAGVSSGIINGGNSSSRKKNTADKTEPLSRSAAREVSDAALARDERFSKSEIETRGLFSGEDDDDTYHKDGVFLIYPHELDCDVVEEVINELGLQNAVVLTTVLEEASAVLAVKSRVKNATWLRHAGTALGLSQILTHCLPIQD